VRKLYYPKNPTHEKFASIAYNAKPRLLERMQSHKKKAALWNRDITQVGELK